MLGHEVDSLHRRGTLTRTARGTVRRALNPPSPEVHSYPTWPGGGEKWVGPRLVRRGNGVQSLVDLGPTGGIFDNIGGLPNSKSKSYAILKGPMDRESFQESGNSFL